ncbi:hypothetical protein V6N12_050419 [Hibiscus sabdariffa]|uniref:Reverse transcriptase Ty1/copia-type domain-containing protein n=1 Tax=Hibiscus sabdariffa TaxID=183260 RepID=A0ABR2GD92_9ROSI
MIKSIRILLAVAAFHDYEIWQMDVKTAFLNGKLEEDVYMTQPEGFVTPEDARKVCKLQRSIYGLKQASRSWNLRFNEAIQEFGFIRNEDEPFVYKKFSGSIVSFLVLYVDDILIIGNDIPTLQSIKTWLSSCFSMKDLEEAAYILGVKIYRDRSRRLLGLSQSTYIDKVLKRFSMEESKRGFLPMRHGISLSKEMCPSTPQERERMSQIPYASAIGSIMYAMICHWTSVKYILKYLRRTKDIFLVYGGEEELRIKGYTDASFQTDKDDSRSQLGFVFCLNGASEAIKEDVGIKEFISELRVVPSILDAVGLYCDNNGAIAQAKEPRSHHGPKHNFRIEEQEKPEDGHCVDKVDGYMGGAVTCCLVGQVSYMWSLLGTNSPRASKDKFEKHMDDMVDVGCLMLATMTPKFQKQHENMVSYEMIQNLKEIFERKA